ncbi:MAG: class I SAM-dependent methyltransferase, partial [Gammaproteobacteria bacterium]|nr:class I SAM-dependent methyltransferase [Gammaproteobacteria bacterium]
MSEYTALLNYVHKIAQPERLTAIESWHRHIPFAFAVLQMTRPSVFVELGTHRGDSYSAFCQGVTLYGLGTHCYAVDTWQGDSQAGYYGDDIYNELSAWHDPRYARFSSLLRMTFDDALAHFADGTVDLLHIDGLHTYDAVRHDFESWLPKLSSRGVVLFHDTNVRRDDFGVWQLWEELSQRYPAFEFPYGFGLGVLVVGQDAPQEMLDFIAYAQREPQHVIDVFHGLGDTAAYRKASEALVQTRDQLASIGSQLMEARAVVVTRDEQLAQLNQHIREVTEQREALVAERQRLGDDLLHAREVVQTRDGQLASLARRISEHEAELNDLRVLRQAFQQLQQTLQVEDAERTRLEALLKLVLNSRFWRMRNSLMGLLGKHESVLDTRVLRTSDRALRGPRPTIDIIIPVYRSIDDTRRCI